MASKKLKQSEKKNIYLAFYQFCLDHAWMNKEKIIVKLEIKDINDFIYRIGGRENGIYRNTLEDIKYLPKRKYEKLENEIKTLKNVIVSKHPMSDYQSIICQSIDTGYNPFKKLALFLYRKCKNYLFK